ncbi:LPD29 domain-containing protein [Arcobacter sp. FWKO B]|uniref:LPD29 domain-containing protein n=1 Tax=Arcobacter sp. FWKO B TaxID=2593672 RepID=UPI0018A59608|nr:LPD29 domain-containing protein [Arcobacter sp. FWKO B]QOG13029.1 hypothetical protein FWKOB_10165 [Arcobacter sp. FWKO B]
MAYIKTEQVKAIRDQIKKEFPNVKFSVTREHYSSVKIVILSSEIDFFADYIKTIERYEAERTYLQVNHHYIDTSFTGLSKEVLSKISEIAHSQNWFDESDSMTDYFHTAYYVGISIGDWSRPYQLKILKEVA